MATAERSRWFWRLFLMALASGVLVGCTTPAPAAAPPSAAGAGSAASSAAPATTAPPPAAARPPLRVAYVTPAAVMVPLWMAYESGAFEREGVAVEMRYIQANAAVAALLAGEVDLLEISGPPVLTAALQGGDIVFIAGALNQMIFSVHARPEVRSAADLRGKLLGTDRPGTPVGFGAQVAVEKLGLRPDEVQILNVGSSDQVLAALLSGQLAAGVLAPPHNFLAEDAGYPKLVDLYEVPYQNIGIAARRSQLDALAPSLLPFLRAYREGIDRYIADKAAAVQVIEKYSQES